MFFHDVFGLLTYSELMQPLSGSLFKACSIGCDLNTFYMTSLVLKVFYKKIKYCFLYVYFAAFCLHLFYISVSKGYGAL